MSNAVILGLSLSECDGIYPRTRDGQCHGCGTYTATEREHHQIHRRSGKTAQHGKTRLHFMARDGVDWACADCGIRLNSDVAWTDDPTAYRTPPDGYIPCGTVMRARAGA